MTTLEKIVLLASAQLSNCCCLASFSSERSDCASCCADLAFIGSSPSTWPWRLCLRHTVWYWTGCPFASASRRGAVKLSGDRGESSVERKAHRTIIDGFAYPTFPKLRGPTPKNVGNWVNLTTPGVFARAFCGRRRWSVRGHCDPAELT
jgi:hypothetical protein